jgi:hypothetical protein
LTYPSEKYEGQLGLFFPISGKIKNVRNHQPDIYYITLMGNMRKKHRM